jgi:hypothetical protein
MAINTLNLFIGKEINAMQFLLATHHKLHTTHKPELTTYNLQHTTDYPQLTTHNPQPTTYNLQQTL